MDMLFWIFALLSLGNGLWMLLAPESGWINGQRIEVSGGMGL